MKVQEYIQEDGSNPYQKWFDDLDAIVPSNSNSEFILEFNQSLIIPDPDGHSVRLVKQ